MNGASKGILTLAPLGRPTELSHMQIKLGDHFFLCISFTLLAKLLFAVTTFVDISALLTAPGAFIMRILFKPSTTLRRLSEHLLNLFHLFWTKVFLEKSRHFDYCPHCLGLNSGPEARSRPGKNRRKKKRPEKTAKI